MKIRAPAKINLTLRVLGTRADGYHLLDTIMAPVSLYDDIEIRKVSPAGKSRPGNERIQIRCDHPDVPPGKANLAYQAARVILKKFPDAPPVSIHIKKRIPVGAGLGGGSTDAAATLVGINRVFNLRWSLTALEKIALSLGADVPFFIRARPVRATGIGEKLRRQRGMPRFWAVVVYPGFPVATAWVYRNLGQKLTKPIVNTSIASSFNSIDELARRLVNDLEGVTLKRYPGIAVLKKKLLQQGALGSLMSGSGSAVFGIFASKRAAAHAFRRLRTEEGAQAFLVHSVN